MRVGLWLILLAVAACTPPPGRVATQPDPYSRSDRADAAQQLQDIRAQLAAGQAAAARRGAEDLLLRYPGMTGEDEVLWVGGQAAVQSDDFRTATRWYRRLLADHPESPRVGGAHLGLAEVHAHRAAWPDAALHYVMALDTPGAVDEASVAAVRSETRRILEDELTLDQLETLRGQIEPEGVAASTVAYLIIQRRFHQDPPDDTALGQAMEAFLAQYPDSRFAPEVGTMFAEVQQRSGYQPQPGTVATPSADRIGILCPLTGENASLGQAMYDGALLALEEHNRRTGANYALVSRDTRGDGVRAVEAARDLIENEGALAMVGALLTSTTIPVATLCQERSVPLISPTATQENITELGDFVFQTNLTKAVETRLVARAAVDYLLKRRFAIVYPKTEEGTHAAELFAQQVEQAGARVVSMEGLERGITDFGPVLRRVRKAGPEAIFAPLSASEMRLLAPQLTFYNLETQLLGPSGWNNSLLSREVGEYLDRAIFPSDIALIPNAERDRFDDQWRRRYPGAPASPFALKTFFAVQQILAAMQQGIDSRAGLQLYLEGTLGFAGESQYLGLEKLRMMSDGSVGPFPVAMFPAPRLEPQPEMPPEGFLDDGR